MSSLQNQVTRLRRHHHPASSMLSTSLQDPFQPQPSPRMGTPGSFMGSIPTLFPVLTSTDFHNQAEDFSACTASARIDASSMLHLSQLEARLHLDRVILHNCSAPESQALDIPLLYNDLAFHCHHPPTPSELALWFHIFLPSPDRPPVSVLHLSSSIQT